MVLDACDLGGLRCTSFALSKVSFYVGHMFVAQWEGIPTEKISGDCSPQFIQGLKGNVIMNPVDGFP